jgi:hypothetical protein
VALWAAAAQARNLMSADGPGGTYELLRQAYTTELPDCGHMVPHITEDFDKDLGKNVFIFHAHVNLDDDRCGGTDRQRTEIRARASDIVAQNGETVWYRWKFKLDAAFQGSPRFTHIFQIKSDLGAPIMTLTPRVSTFGTTGRVGSTGTTDLAKFRGVWVVVDLKVLYSNAGRAEVTIRRIPDGAMLFSQASNADMWDDNASGHDSKFGIYRSLDAKEQLRDEQVRFADFCASKVSAKECDDGIVPSNGGGPVVTPPADAGAGARPDAGAGGMGGTGGEIGGAGGAGGGAGAGGSSGGAGGGSGSGGGGASGSGGSASGGSGGSGGGTKPSPRDAAASPPREDPPSTTDPETPGSRPRSSGGCTVGAAGSGAAATGGSCLLLALAALGRRRRRR